MQEHKPMSFKRIICDDIIYFELIPEMYENHLNDDCGNESQRSSYAQLNDIHQTLIEFIFFVPKIDTFY